MEARWGKLMHLLATLLCCAGAGLAVGNKIRENINYKTFLSPVFELAPGDVRDRYYSVEFPQGHVAIRSFSVKIIDADSGNPVHLSELYVHHWVMVKVGVRSGFKELLSSAPLTPPPSSGRSAGDVVHRHVERMAFRPEAEPLKEMLQFEGVCQSSRKDQYFGGGPEIRHTNVSIPAPYGIVIGDNDGIPDGYEEAWYLNLHTIDLRGAVDVKGCTECVCDLYNATVDQFGRPLSAGYRGGLFCCYDMMSCAVKAGFPDKPRRVQMLYTLSWVDWDQSIMPLRAYILDVTDPRTSLHEKPRCATEYEVYPCVEGAATEDCIDVRHAIAGLPKGGDLIFAYAHQHTGALGARVFNEAGVNICESLPIYGQGSEAGNEAGWVTGLTVCAPEPGSVKIRTMEELRLEAMYSSAVGRTGVMSLFNMYIADSMDELEPLELEGVNAAEWEVSHGILTGGFM